MNADDAALPGPPESGYLQSDEPITRRSHDRLNRASLAGAIAEQVIQSPPGQGFVIAIDGPWGSGKTSVLNLIEESVAERSDAVILRFNPWLFSGTEQLVVRFMQELSVQLGEKPEKELHEIGKRLARYGDVLVPLGWVPVVGSWLSRIGSVAKVFSGQKLAPSAAAQKERVRLSLEKLERRVLVILDDLDRVEAEQVRDVVRLIKLVADFPNVTYLLAYDGAKVAAAVGPDLPGGREYMEKIVQVTHALPDIDDRSLVVLLQTELDAVINPIDHGPFDRDDWVNIFHTSMRPFFRNVRDVRRYLNAVPVPLRLLGREVALVDALALETLRVFAPAAHVRLPAMVRTLTGEGRTVYDGDTQERTAADARAIAELIAASVPHEEAVRQMLQRLFPTIGGHVGGTTIHSSGQEHRRERRVAHPDVLRIYLRRTLPEGATPTGVVQAAYEAMGDRERLADLLDNLDPQQLEDLFGRLEDYEQTFAPSAAEPATEVLLNTLPRLREDMRGMMDFGARIAVTRLVLRLLARVEDENERLEIVKRVLPRVVQLSGREELIDLVGHRENSGHKLIPEEAAAELYRQQNESVLRAEPGSLAAERQLGSLLYRAREFEDGAHLDRIRELCQDDRVLVRLLRSGLSEHRSQSLGDLAVRSTPVLPWLDIADMVGDEETLKLRIAQLRERVDPGQLDERDMLAIETAEGYAAGEPDPRDRFDLE